MGEYRLQPLSRTQELVLRAALGPVEEAMDAWRELLGGGDEIPLLDQGAFRLLPLVYRHLGEGGEPVPAEGILRGIYRQAWYRNQVAAGAVSAVLAELATSGIDAMLLKGWAAVELGYREAGRRPMNDADVLVRPRQFDAACDALERCGFRPLSGVGRSRRGRRTFHAVAFQNVAGIDIDLHHHMLEEANLPGGDAGLWERSSPRTFGDAPVRYPAVEDLVINVCVHGVRWDPVPPIRWLADAVTLIRANEVSWTLVSEEAQRRRVSVAMEAALHEVHRFESVPAEAFERLAATRRDALERLDFRAQQGSSGAGAMTRRYITRYLRLTAGRGPLERARRFPVYLQGMWELDSERKVPAEGARRLWARLWGRTPVRGRQN